MKNIRSNWQGAVLVCGKCTKKVGGGFGPKGKSPLAKELRKHCGIAKGRKGVMGLVETKCLDICPKNAVVAVNTQSGVCTVVPPGAEIGAVAERLGIGCRKA